LTAPLSESDVSQSLEIARCWPHVVLLRWLVWCCLERRSSSALPELLHQAWATATSGRGEGTGKPPAAYATSWGCTSNQCTPCSWARFVGGRRQNAIMAPVAREVTFWTPELTVVFLVLSTRVHCTLQQPDRLKYEYVVKLSQTGGAFAYCGLPTVKEYDRRQKERVIRLGALMNHA